MRWEEELTGLAHPSVAQPARVHKAERAREGERGAAGLQLGRRGEMGRTRWGKLGRAREKKEDWAKSRRRGRKGGSGDLFF